MRVIETNRFPSGRFLAINLFGIVFVRRERWMEKTDRQKLRTLNHEAIHTAQMKDLLYVGFFVCYFLEWIWWLIFRTGSAYRHINFEKEAYSHQADMSYLQSRRPFAQWRTNR